MEPKASITLGDLFMINVAYIQKSKDHLQRQSYQENTVILMSKFQRNHLSTFLFTKQLVRESLKELDHHQGRRLSNDEFLVAQIATYLGTKFCFSSEFLSSNCLKPIICLGLYVTLADEAEPRPRPPLFNEEVKFPDGKLINLGTSFRHESILDNLEFLTGIEVESGRSSYLFGDEVIAKVDYSVKGCDSNDLIDECPVCLEKFREDNRKPAIARTACSHKFHQSCLLKWLGRNEAACPVCRSSCIVWVSGSVNPMHEKITFWNEEVQTRLNKGESSLKHFREEE
ncbi:OLC1v1035425C1 [Oldenlandia corymbosa var. corymbosa]|uniref:RING-type E3 ubiquitin transferase n=1 Tax=Oldenlandia corymbosa var. corymbosa TaxID=529605 RepID=A0AAV1CTQ6_OLDCO|nr:OLC1v1035425C1 [Oldenlandia corymbosa var. corymbosa]